MDKVVPDQLLSKRTLDKQLNETEAQEHFGEIRRLKQIRDYGVDLSKIHKTTRELDEVSNDLSPRYHDQRRGSLPLDCRSEPSFSLKQMSPFSKRRLSCVASIALSPSDHDEFPSNASFQKESSSSHKQIPAIKNERGGILSSSLVDPDKSSEKDREEFINKIKTKTDLLTAGRRASSGRPELIPPSLKERRGSYNGSANSSNDSRLMEVTSPVFKDYGKPASGEISEAELQSIFADAKRSSRRSSEPEMRSYLFRGLQDLPLWETSAFQHPNGIGCQGLKKSIQKNLPSDIVAETDEDEKEVLANKGEISSTDCDLSPRAGVRVRLSSISESDQDGDQKEGPCNLDESDYGAGSIELLKVSDAVRNKNFKIWSQRRKSDGDVLINDNARKADYGSKIQSGITSSGHVGAALVASRMQQNFANKAKVSGDM